ncbi:MAG: NB-ARC domain-containing protein [Ardenticatenaceae bacterium]|nr:NB-ARC domain-containing protein [Ardenticatenaceae bacterium]
MEAIFHLRLFGAVQVEREGKPVRGFKSRKALAVLSYLALQARPVSRSHLADLFWGEKTEARGRANLSWVLHRLATLLPGCLQVDRHSVQFRPGPRFWLDTVAFVDLVAQGEPAALAAAAELYRGEFLAGLELEGCPEFETWLVVQRESWHQRATRVLQELIAYHTGRGEYRAGLRWAMRLLALDPWREEAHRQVMWLLARTGQRGAALAQYESCRRVLAEEFGAEPSQETQALYERILVAPVRRHNLPLQPTSFVGREAELEALARRLADPGCRLVTIVGPGGIGKTRLAIQAAAQHFDAFLHGVTFVPLTPVSSPEHVIPAVAAALGCSFYGREEPKVQLLKYLGAKELLLVLDNFEHLREGTDLIVDLLEGAPEVKLLVTSRERLNLRAEWLFAIEGLAYPTSSRTTVAPSPLSCQERGRGGGGVG